MSQFADYSSIDPTLSVWAERNGLHWDTDYKGWVVRSCSWPLTGSESVQIWVDEPEGGSAVVHVALNSVSAARRKGRQAAYGFETLSTGLDELLRTARGWMNEEIKHAQD